mmetsp:Transcript_7314/g.13325  ORF Transcript_7314/g.13325 Transcript_7314/m.13325 type:complete len:204 (-) Transcript_7314:34-645(-)
MMGDLLRVAALASCSILGAVAAAVAIASADAGRPGLDAANADGDEEEAWPGGEDARPPPEAGPPPLSPTVLLFVALKGAREPPLPPTPLPPPTLPSGSFVNATAEAATASSSSVVNDGLFLCPPTAGVSTRASSSSSSLLVRSCKTRRLSLRGAGGGRKGREGASASSSSLSLLFRRSAVFSPPSVAIRPSSLRGPAARGGEG